VDQEKFVALLNEDLRIEYQSMVQYVVHISTITGPEFQNIGDELKIHVGQELTHAQILAEQVAFLGGVPASDVPPVMESSDTRTALQQDLALETEQLERYRERSVQAGELGLPDVAEALKPLLTQTQEHVRDLRAALGD
jgi:bacterioferritin